MYKNTSILYLTSTFIFSLTVFMLFTACQGQKSDTEEFKTYNIPEIDKLSAEIAKNKENAALYAARSSIFSEHEMYQEAELDAEKALALDSAKIDYYRLLSNAYFDNNHSLSAIKTAEKAIEKFPEQEGLYLMLGEMLLYLNQYQDGLLTIDKLMKVRPNQPDGLFIQGQILKMMGDTLKALDRFQTVVEQDADHLDAYLQLALLTKNRKDDLNIRYLDNALRIDSLNETALLAKAQHYHLNGRFEEAQKAYETAIIRVPQSYELNYNLALMFLELGDNAEKAGKVEAAEEQYKNAFQHFDNCTKFEPQFADAYFYKGITAERLGKKDIAKTDYQNALKLQSFLGTVSPETVEEALNALK
jgi:tetratricopeptide (TPR) repeat protein